MNLLARLVIINLHKSIWFKCQMSCCCCDICYVIVFRGHFKQKFILTNGTWSGGLIPGLLFWKAAQRTKLGCFQIDKHVWKLFDLATRNFVGGKKISP